MGKSNTNLIPIIIPSYEPDDRLIDLLETIKKAKIGPVVLVNDGSSSKYDSYFDKAKKLIEENDGVVLKHEVNKGKGRALKTAFSYVLDKYDDFVGVVTIDSDGQHSVPCTKKVMETLKENRNSLILGSRNFDLETVPWKSRLGNKITSIVFGFLTGMKVKDTQTGLRGIPKEFMKQLLDVKGERFEFETQMLLESNDKYPIIEVEIETIYDSKDNHQTHFNTFKDSIRIYKVLGKKFTSYVFSSLFSTLIDLILFSILVGLLKQSSEHLYILISTIIARIISCSVNFTINYKQIFKSNKPLYLSVHKYILLSIVQMLLSAGSVTLFVKLFSLQTEVVVKIIVDTSLFFLSYKIQQKYVF